MVALLVIGFVKLKQGLWTLLYLYVGALFHGVHVSFIPHQVHQGKTPSYIDNPNECVLLFGVR